MKPLRQQLEEDHWKNELLISQLRDELDSCKKISTSLEQLNHKYESKNEELKMLLQAAQSKLSEMSYRINVSSDLQNNMTDSEGKKAHDKMFSISHTFRISKLLYT